MGTKIAVMLWLAGHVAIATTVYADQLDSPIPFGGYHGNGKCGCYGTKTAIKTAAEARKIVEGFLAGHDLHIGGIDERPRFFRIVLVDGNKTVRDIVIVDKLTGRVRSIK